MAVRPILVYGAPELEAPNAAVERFDDDLSRLVEDLLETGWRAPGLGLAAPQVGANIRLAVVDLSVGKEPSERLVLANPRVVQQEGKVPLEEGCLSFPGLFTTIERPRRIVVEAQDARGKKHVIEAEDLLAQAICHEIDHLDGRLLIHHLRGLKRRMLLRRINRLRKAGVWTRS
jgi:peptide deformylase